MAVKGNTGEVVVTKGFKTIYGIAPFKVVAINPTQEQLISLGVNAQKEPEYLGDKTRIDIWCKSILPEKKVEGSADKSLEELGIENQLVQKLSIFISDKQKGKEDGSSVVWINGFGNICSTSKGERPEASWWKHHGEHIAREGEIELVKFIRAWVNAASGDEVSIDDWAALIRGNVKELREIQTLFKENIVRSAIEVRISEGKTFAGLYSGHHEPWNITGLNNWRKEFSVTRKNKFYSFQLKEFIPNEPQPDTDAPAASASSEWN